MPAAASEVIVAMSGIRPLVSARFDSGGRSHGSPGPISVTGTPASASARAHI